MGTQTQTQTQTGILFHERSNLQKLVEERKDDGENNGHEPETESHDGQGGVIFVGDNSGNLGDGRVLFFVENDR